MSILPSHNKIANRFAWGTLCDNYQRVHRKSVDQKHVRNTINVVQNVRIGLRRFRTISRHRSVDFTAIDFRLNMLVLERKLSS